MIRTFDVLEVDTIEPLPAHNRSPPQVGDEASDSENRANQLCRNSSQLVRVEIRHSCHASCVVILTTVGPDVS